MKVIFRLLLLSLLLELMDAQAVPDACITNCSLQSCPSLTDLTCLCGANSTIIGACIVELCPAADAALAQSLFGEFCSHLIQS